MKGEGLDLGSRGEKYRIQGLGFQTWGQEERV